MTINVSTLLDVALSLVFIFFTFSLFVSGIVEFVNTWFRHRSRLLKLALIKALDGKDIDKTLRKMVEDIDSVWHQATWDEAAPTFARFWNHPLVRVKRQIDNRWLFSDKPISYLNAESFSTVVLDILASASPNPGQLNDTDKKGATKLMMTRIRQTVADPTPATDLAHPSTAVGLTALASLVGPLLEKSDTLADLKTALEHWYDGYMEQVSGWFKRNTQAVVWLVAGIVTIAMNVDTIRITRQLFMDPKLRDSLVQRAAEVAEQKPQSTTAPTSASAITPGFSTYLDKHDKALNDLLKSGKPLAAEDSLSLQVDYLRYFQTTIVDLGLPIGWTLKATRSTGMEKFKEQLGQIGSQISWLGLLGWFLTAAALSFGAPFWFDLLVKLVNIRNVSKKPASSVVPDK